MSVSLTIYATLSRLAGTLLRGAACLRPDSVLARRLAVDDDAGAPFPVGGIWVHGASVGELVSARALVGALRDALPELPLVITANTSTGVAAAKAWDLPTAVVRLAPLDVPGAVGRFLDSFRPALMLTIENEIWPNRAAAARARGIPQVVVGARMSAKSAARWGRLPGVIGPALSGLSALSAQDQDSEARLLRLGLSPNAVLPRLNLKLLAPAEVARRLPPVTHPARARTWLAASTHEGEERVVLDAHAQALRSVPDLRLILAPRHPDRADAVAALVAAAGFTPSRESLGQPPGAVHLADTLGQMPRWYQAAGICLIGGTLTDRGGHTPWEPAAYACALLAGPDTRNHAEGFAALARADAIVKVTGPADLARNLVHLASQPARQAQMGADARLVLLGNAGDPSGLVSRIVELAPARADTDIN
ncbi:3-deoxy-D-manno-octulosonic acid transferase [Paracoccus pacificus]|uniref:3-deoxy-D-manno-octulosonic acid transferase n=1 Tax=Paracoccus pacificus TaxID=1463598 RepID=A0ABW4RAH7_9RHOB